MAKEYGNKKDRNKEQPQEAVQEMSLEESKAYRASLYVAQESAPTEEEKKEAFRVFWAQHKNKVRKGKDLEQIIWLHLKAIKMDSPDKFSEGLRHFGIKEV